MSAMWIQTWAILVSTLGLLILGFFFENRRLDDLRTDVNSHLAEFGRVFAAVEGRFGHLEARFSATESRFNRIDERFERMEQRLDERLARLAERIENRFNSLHQDLAVFRALLQDALRPRTA